MTLPSIYIYNTILFARRNLHLFSTHAHKHLTRGKNLLIVPKVNLNIYRKSPHFNAVTLYNTLPNEIKNVSQMPTFKKVLKQFLVSNCFYSISDYANIIT